MARRSRRKRKEADAATDAATDAPTDAPTDAKAPDAGETKEDSDDERDGEERRHDKRRKKGRRRGDFLGAIQRIGLAVWGFAFFALLVGFYGGYGVWTEFKAPVTVDQLPPLPTLRRTAPVSASSSFTLQFQPFHVRSTIAGESVRVAITPYVEVRAEADLAALCQNHTAVQYIIRQILDRQFRNDHGADTDYSAVVGDMRDEINQMLAAQLVTEVKIVTWRPPRSSRATATSSLPPQVCGGFGQ